MAKYVLSETDIAKRYETSEDVAHIVEALSAENHNEIHLSLNSFGAEAMEAVCAVLKNNNEIEICQFSDMFTGRNLDAVLEGMIAVKDALVDKENLRFLDLSDNAFGPRGVAKFTELITENRNIRELILNNNGLGISGITMIAQALAEDTEACKLEVVIAGRNRLETEGITELSNVLREINTLRKLSIPQNGINPEGISKVAEVLEANTEIEHVDIYDNNVKSEGTDALVAVLPKLSNLKHFNAGDCNLQQEDVTKILNALKENTTLEYIEFTYADLDDEILPVLEATLANKPNIKTVNVNGNMFTEDGIESLKAMMSEDVLGSLSDNEGDFSDFSDEE